MSDPTADTEAATAALLGTWSVTSAGGVSTPDGVSAHLTFDPDGRMHGKGGVNNIGGAFAVETEGNDGLVLVIGPVFSTLMAGPEDAMAHEYRITSALDGRLALEFDGDRALLGRGAVELVRAEDVSP